MDGKKKSAKQIVPANNNLPRIEENHLHVGSATNECDDDEEFVERYLTISNMSFSILPNGGTGDCLFKAISQAIFEGDESEHLPIRQQVVSFIAEKTWEKYQVSVQVQHINGHNNLQKSWDENPIEAYKNYMLEAGTLGSFLELNAAGELYQFNFASIQEYNDSVGLTYRVENSIQFPNKRVPMHYFLFTGDFDNGHWEYLKNCKKRGEIVDGTYNGTLDIVIEGQVSSVEFWLMENTQIGQAEYDDVAQSIYLRKRGKYPFDCPLLRFENDKTVELIDISYVITPSKYSDLFSVLANSHLRNESLSKEMHDLLTTYRNNNFSSLNYKLITQPQSHGFTTDVLKYASMSYKGNIQDLLSAADLYGFSFTLYLILTNVIHLCKFIHVDRWGSEVSTMEYFFINMIPSLLSNRTKVCAHWYHLVPVKALSYDPPENYRKSSLTTSKKEKSVRKIDCEQLAAAINLENKKYIKNKAKDLYNLYFDRQLNHPNDDGGDSSVKPSSIQESDVIHLKEMPQKFGKRETTIIEGNSHLIEMKPNVVYRYGLDSNFKLNRKQTTDGENSNQIDKNKSHHSVKKASSQDLRMTPSNLLYARPSFTFNGLDRKTSKPGQKLESNIKEAKGIIQDSKAEMSSIAESAIYNKIILEHKINSTNASSAGSLKSVKSMVSDNNSVVCNRSDSKDLRGDDTKIIEEAELIAYDSHDVHQCTRSEDPIPSENDQGKDSKKEEANRKNSYTVSRRDSKKVTRNDSYVIRRNDSGNVGVKDSYVISREDSEKVETKHSNEICKTISDTSKTDLEKISRKGSRLVDKNDSTTISRNDADVISGKDSNTISGKDSNTISGKDSNTISRKDSDVINRKHSNDTCRKNDTTLKDSKEIGRKESEGINRKYSDDICRKCSDEICRKSSDAISRKSLDVISGKCSDAITRKYSDAISRKCSDAIIGKCPDDIQNKYSSIGMNNSDDNSRKSSDEGSRKFSVFSEDISRKFSVFSDASTKFSDDMNTKDADAVNRKESNDFSRKDSEKVRKRDPTDDNKKDWEDICKKDWDTMSRTESEDISNKYWGKAKRKHLGKIFKNVSRKTSRKYLENISRKDLKKISRKHLGPVSRNSSRIISKNDSEKVRRKTVKVRRNQSEKVDQNTMNLKEKEVAHPASDIISSYYYTSQTHNSIKNGNISESSTVYKSAKKYSAMSFATKNSNISTDKESNQNLNTQSSVPPQARERTASGNWSVRTDRVTSLQKECQLSDDSDSDVEEENDIYTRYCRHQLAIMKSEGEMLAKQKPGSKRTARSLSQRMALLAKDSLSKFRISKNRKIKPAKSPFCDSNNNFSPRNMTLVKKRDENIVANVVVGGVRPTLSLASLESGQDKPFMREVVQQRMRKESNVPHTDESLQTLRPSTNSSHHQDRQGAQEKPGCLRKMCRAIGSLCTCGTKKETV